jgi:hypothetical protein
MNRSAIQGLRGCQRRTLQKEYFASTTALRYTSRRTSHIKGYPRNEYVVIMQAVEQSRIKLLEEGFIG